MNTCTAMRYFKDTPVPAEVLEQLVYAPTRASSPGNSQAWHFLIIDDPMVKEVIGPKVLAEMAPFFANRPEDKDAVEERMMQGAEHLARYFADVPAWIVCMADNVYPPHAPEGTPAFIRRHKISSSRLVHWELVRVSPRFLDRRRRKSERIATYPRTCTCSYISPLDIRTKHSCRSNGGLSRRYWSGTNSSRMKTQSKEHDNE